MLYRRTGEERQEIIIKKIGILLLEKENFHDQNLEKLEINFISSHLEEAWDKVFKKKNSLYFFFFNIYPMLNVN